MKVLVCGSRDWTDGQTIFRTLAELPSGTTVINGAARGADNLAGKSAAALGMKVETYPANWQLYGRAAGPIRNKQMLDEGKPDRVIAFRLMGVSRGTDDMIRQSEAAGLPVTVIHAVSEAQS